MRKLLLFIFGALLLASCKLPTDGVEDKEYTVINCTKEIKTRAFKFAELYRDSDTEYVLGGQSPVRAAIQIDCSGLVIMCYKYAIVDTKYMLIEPDMTAAYICNHAAEITETPEQGDLIFMGELGTDAITHIAIYDREENGEIYFIDSTDNGTVNGVTERHYEKNNEKFKKFGVMKLKF